MSAHQPIRPTWVCVGCGHLWPCPSRRRQLLAEYTGAPASLSLLLGSALVRATADLPTAAAGDLHDRFVGWLPAVAPSGFGRPR
ncbi:hypothetical protein ACNTMW_33710 [Planosporangium sp. 12N6]|uniref:hypothetical protein n=1 Tax=Planosporangium spinosum TaxID=3402278 RepID=UPI003CE7110B